MNAGKLGPADTYVSTDILIPIVGDVGLSCCRNLRHTLHHRSVDECPNDPFHSDIANGCVATLADSGW